MTELSPNRLNPPLSDTSPGDTADARGAGEAPRHRAADPSSDPSKPPPSGSPPPAFGLRAFARGTAAVLAKDLRIELATGEIVTTAGFFAILVAIMASVAFTAGLETTTRVAPGALWLAIAFSSVLALGRSWHREREESALVGLLVSPIPRAAIWCGKAIGVLAFVLSVEALVVPIVALLFHIDLLVVVCPLAVVALLGTVGVAATGTLFGAMTVRTRARELLLASVLFTLLWPVLLAGVAATRDILYAAAAAGASGTSVDVGEVSGWLVLLLVYDAVAVTGGIAMFGALLED
jgi:heme exporter protein B